MYPLVSGHHMCLCSGLYCVCVRARKYLSCDICCFLDFQFSQCLLVCVCVCVCISPYTVSFILKKQMGDGRGNSTLLQGSPQTWNDTHRVFHQHTLITIYQVCELMEIITIVSVSRSASQTLSVLKHVINKLKCSSN